MSPSPTTHGSSPIKEILAQSMEFSGIRRRDLILRQIRSQIKSSYSHSKYVLTKGKYICENCTNVLFVGIIFYCMNLYYFLPPHKLHCFMPTVVQLVQNITATKTEGYDTQNRQIYSSKGGPNVMER